MKPASLVIFAIAVAAIVAAAALYFSQPERPACGDILTADIAGCDILKDTSK
jgi:hypothetical protein